MEVVWSKMRIKVTNYYLISSFGGNKYYVPNYSNRQWYFGSNLYLFCHLTHVISYLAFLINPKHNTISSCWKVALPMQEIFRQVEKRHVNKTRRKESWKIMAVRILSRQCFRSLTAVTTRSKLKLPAPALYKVSSVFISCRKYY